MVVSMIELEKNLDGVQPVIRVSHKYYMVPAY